MYKPAIEAPYSLSLRARLEQRNIEFRDGASHRLRLQAKVTRALEGQPYYLAAMDELFLNLNSVNPGPKGGLDQNRLYFGAGAPLADGLKAELGYQWQFINQVSPAMNTSAHILMTQLMCSF